MSQTVPRIHVCYGAFSCTIEGIAAPGDVVAELARCLADHARADPAFGQPDAARSTDERSRDTDAPVQASRVEHADPDTTLQDAAPSHDPQDIPPDPPEIDDPEGGLSPAQEAALSEALRALEADIGAPTKPGKRHRRDTQAKRGDAGDSTSPADVSRLMESAERVHETPENTARRGAFRHSRAAVAAKRAGNETEDTSRTDARADAFQNDLAEAMDGNGPGRPAPLRLAAAQRVEGQKGDPQDNDGFAAFAQAEGADTLPDLLEAGAVYLSRIGDTDSFARSDLMALVTEVRGDDIPREETLRAFGTLLRENRMIRTGAGRFHLPKPGNARAAG